MLLQISPGYRGMLQSKYHHVTQFYFPPWQTDWYALLTIQCRILRWHKIHAFIKIPPKPFCSPLRNSLFYITSIFPQATQMNSLLCLQDAHAHCHYFMYYTSSVQHQPNCRVQRFVVKLLYELSYGQEVTPSIWVGIKWWLCKALICKR